MQIRRKPGVRQAEHAEEYAALVAAFDADMVMHAAQSGEVPDDWADVWRGRTKDTVKLSIRVDEDVAKFFRSMGPGFGPRMNRVLRAFVVSRLAGFLHGGAMPDAFRKTWMTWHHGGEGDMVVSRAIYDEMHEILQLQCGLIEELAHRAARRGDVEGSEGPGGQDGGNG